MCTMGSCKVQQSERLSEECRESSFICRRCKGELSETRQVNGLHIDGHEYEIVDKFCYLGDMLSQEGAVSMPY